MRGAAPLFVALLAIMGCAMVLAEEEGQPMTEYLKEGILAGGRRGSTAAGAYSWGNNGGASSNRAGNVSLHPPAARTDPVPARAAGRGGR